MPISAAPLNSSSYKIPEAVYAKHNGVYKEVQRIYGKRGGEYKQIYYKKNYELYGIHLVPGETHYDITYLEDAAGKSPAYMNFETGVFNYGGWENAFFMPRPCMLKYDGTVDYYLYPGDYTRKLTDYEDTIYTSTTVSCVQGNFLVGDGSEAITYGTISTNTSEFYCRTSVITIPPKVAVKFDVTSGPAVMTQLVETETVEGSLGIGKYFKLANAFYNHSSSNKYVMLAFKHKDDTDGTIPLTPSDFILTMTTHTITTDIGDETYGGNAMMEWPKIWYKFAPGTVDGEGYFYVSDQKIDDSYHCWCNLDCNGNEIDHFYTAIYSYCSTTSGGNRIRSLSGKGNYSRKNNIATFVSTAKANNTDANKVEWYIDTFSDHQLIDALLMLIGKTTKFAATYGKGLSEPTGSSGHIEASYHNGVVVDNKGLFWGDNSGYYPVKVFGMENWWGYQLRFIAGAMHRDSTFYYKLTYSTADGSSSSEYSEYKTSESTTPVGYFTKTAATSWSMVETKAINKFIFDDNLYYPDLRTQKNAFTDMVLDYKVYGYAVTRMLSLGGYINETTSRSKLTWNFEIHGNRGFWYQYGASLSCKPISHISQEVPTEIL